MHILLIIIAISAVTASLDLISILTYAGYVLQVDAIGVALVSVAMFAPLAVLGRAYSIIVNQFSLRNLLAMSLAVRALSTLLMFWANELPIFLVLILCRSTAIGLFYPSIAVAARQYKTQGRFAPLNNLINSVAKIAAPLVGGLLGVLIGEKFVFMVSALACIAVLPIVWQGKYQMPNDHTAAASEHQSQMLPRISFPIWWKIGVPVLGVNGLSIMMSNLTPYALNLYLIPKLTLSIALSSSALSGVLCNLYFVKRPVKVINFPAKIILGAWIGIGVGFAGFTMSLPVSIAAILVPFWFVCITVGKTCFTVAMMGYIFDQPKPIASQLASIEQSLAAASGIFMTIVGAVAMSGITPIVTMMVAAVGSSIIAVIWYVCWQKSNVQNAK